MTKIIEVFKRTEEIKIPIIIALVNTILKKIQFVEQLDKLIPWDEPRTNLSPGMLAKALVLSTLFELRAPLSHISERFRTLDTEYLFGKDVTYEQINSFNIGRMLGKLGNCDCVNIFKMLVSMFFKEFMIRIKRLHSDTTTVTFSGDYTDIDEGNLTEEEKEELLHIVRGYNKDGRPEDKQVVLGRITNEDGLPIINEVLDGNTSDKEWNKKSLEYVYKLIEEGAEEAILVADCKLVDEKLFRQMNDKDKKIPFISLCPASFDEKLQERVIEKAYENKQWEDIGSIADGKKAAKYEVAEISENVYGYDTRLLVVYSTALESTVEEGIEKSKEKLEKLIKDTQKKKYECREDAEKELIQFKKAHKKLNLHDCECRIEEEIKETKANGRPSNNNPKPVTITTSYKIVIKITGENPKKVEKYRHNKSCFVLISNVDKDRLDSKELLETYKGQIVVETSFRYFKEGSLASVIFLKDPIRITGLIMLLNVSLLIRGLIQYSMRKGLKEYKKENPNDELRIGWNGQPLKAPTFKLFYKASEDNYFVKEGDEKYIINYYSDFNKLQVGMLLKFMGYKVQDLL
ncbi:MAG: IS1634 family transposase [Oscillospiraceae bacterium]|nr:IS1634 family transposase [Oscillospiraceae bacterium]